MRIVKWIKKEWVWIGIWVVLSLALLFSIAKSADDRDEEPYMDVALTCFELAQGDSTLLPFEAIEIETGRIIEYFCDYQDTLVGPIATYDESIEPGVGELVDNGGWVLVWLPPNPISVPETPTADITTVEHGGCGKWFSLGR